MSSELERAFDTYAKILAPQLEFTPEHRAIPKRRFRIDRAHLLSRVAIELQGGVWSKGRHVRGKGYESDCEKHCLLQVHGWSVMPITSKMLHDDPDRVFKWIRAVVQNRLNGGC